MGTGSVRRWKEGEEFTALPWIFFEKKVFCNCMGAKTHGFCRHLIALLLELERRGWDKEKLEEVIERTTRGE